jgi:hypothetical protein
MIAMMLLTVASLIAALVIVPIVNFPVMLGLVAFGRAIKGNRFAMKIAVVGLLAVEIAGGWLVLWGAGHWNTSPIVPMIAYCLPAISTLQQALKGASAAVEV